LAVAIFAIASAIIGGTSFFGGKGRIINVLIGGLIIGSMQQIHTHQGRRNLWKVHYRFSLPEISLSRATAAMISPPMTTN